MMIQQGKKINNKQTKFMFYFGSRKCNVFILILITILRGNSFGQTTQININSVQAIAYYDKNGMPRVPSTGEKTICSFIRNIKAKTARQFILLNKCDNGDTIITKITYNGKRVEIINDYSRVKSYKPNKKTDKINESLDVVITEKEVGKQCFVTSLITWKKNENKTIFTFYTSESP